MISCRLSFKAFRIGTTFNYQSGRLIHTFIKSKIGKNKNGTQVRTFFCSSKRQQQTEKKPPEHDSVGKFLKDYFPAFLAIIAGNVTWIILKEMGLVSQESREDEALRMLAPTVTWKSFFDDMLSAGEVEKITVISKTGEVFVQLYRGALLPRSYNQETAHAGVYEEIKSQMNLNAAHKGGYYVFKLEMKDIDAFESHLREAERQLGVPAQEGVLVHYVRPNSISPFALSAIYFGMYKLVTFLISRRAAGPKATTSYYSSMFTGMLDGIRKAQFKVVDSNFQVSENLKVKFSDVVGLKEPKIEIQEFVEYLKVPEKYTRLGAKLPKGALLLGPPGCGKTLLAKAVASEANVPFLAMNGTEFIEMIGGLGAARVRDLFKEAKRRAPCMIYIDEIDAIGRKRSGDAEGFSGHSEHDHTLNQLLVEMDGMDSAKGVVIIASTNRADILDKALMRRGRFDRHIDIDLPTLAEREETFEYYLKKIKLDQPAHLYAPTLAKMTPGFSGADINNVCNEAAIKAATAHDSFVKEKHIYASLDRVLCGPEKRSTTVSPEEKSIVAYHESGHALVGWLLKHTNALLKVTIVPRTTSALGFAQYNPQDKKIYSEDELLDRMCMMLGGRAAEILVFASPTSGASNDLTKVTEVAYQQVKMYGMSRKLGPFSFAPMPQNGMVAEEYVFEKPYSKKLDTLIDQEANTIVRQAYQRAESILRENRKLLDTLAQALLARETLTYDDIVKLIGPPRFQEGKKLTESLELELPQTITKDT